MHVPVRDNKKDRLGDVRICVGFEITEEKVRDAWRDICETQTDDRLKLRLVMGRLMMNQTAEPQWGDYKAKRKAQGTDLFSPSYITQT